MSAQAESAFWRDGRVFWPSGSPADVLAILGDQDDDQQARIVMPAPHRNGFIVRGNFERAADVTDPDSGQLLVFATVDDAVRAVIGEPRP